jgi:hypothetical protein
MNMWDDEEERRVMRQALLTIASIACLGVVIGLAIIFSMR